MDSTGLENPLLDADVEANSGEQTFTFCAGNETVESAADGTSHLWNQEGCSEATVADLQEYFNSANNLQETFGDFDRYLQYMTEREALIESGEYDPGSWGSAVEGGVILEGPFGVVVDPDDYNNMSPNDFMAKYGLDKSEVEEIQVDTTKARQDGYNAWLESDAVQELNAAYGIDNTLRTEDGREYQWNGSGWVKVTEPDNMDFGRILKTVTAIAGSAAIGNALGPIIGGAIGGPVGAAAGSGAVSGAISSTLGQLVINGEVNPEALLQAMLLGGLNGIAAGAIAGDLSGTALDNAIWDLSGALGMSYEDVTNILQGMATGAITGDELTDIAMGAIGGWTESQTMDWLRGAFGDEVNIDDWFKDGQSNIPIEALEPIVDQIIGGVVDGSLDDPGAWLKTVWDYFQQGGDIDFMLPPGVDIGSLFDKSLFDFSLCEADLVTGEKPWYCDVNLPDVPNPCEEGQVLNELGLCEWPDLPNPCEEGQVLNELGVCEWPDIEIPNPCEEGQVLNELGVCEWPDVPNPCEEGQVLNELGLCEWPDIDNPCEEGQILNEAGLCEWPELPDVVECMEGFEWSDLYGECIPKIPDDIDVVECMEGYQWSDLYKKCVPVQIPELPDGPDLPDLPDGPEIPDIDIINPCEEGQILDEAGLCQWPDIDLNFTSEYDYEMGPRARQYAYTPFKPVEAQPVREFEHLLNNPLLDDGMFS